MNTNGNMDTPEERRFEQRNMTDRYYSVEVKIEGLPAIYQFKIWNLSLKGMCLLVKKESAILEHIRVGDILTMKYHPIKPLGSPESLITEIRHISKEESGRFKDHCLVGLLVRNKQVINKESKIFSGKTMA